MSLQKSTDCYDVQDLFSKPLFCEFNRERISSDGGAILLKAADRSLNLIHYLSESIPDKRDPSKIKHTLEEMLSQRIYAIACGHPDCNDAVRLADDPVHKLLAGRADKGAPALASQSTLCRFENSLRTVELYQMADALAERIIAHHSKRLNGRARRITLDLDPTKDSTHGQQQQTFFNAFYDSYCYLPMLGFMTFDNEPDQYLFAAVLRPGNVSASRGAIGILKRVFEKLRTAFPKAEILVRLDGGFANEEVFAFLEFENVNFVVNMSKNSVLKKKAEKLMKKARRHSKKSGQSERANLNPAPGRMPVCCGEMESGTAHHHQSRNDCMSWPRPTRQSTFPGDESDSKSRVCLRKKILQTRRCGESHQRT